MPELSAEQRRALVGDDDNPGLLDQYKIRASNIGDSEPVVVWLCLRQHGEEGHHLGVIARDTELDQTGLTLGELVEAALDHEAEAH